MTTVRGSIPRLPTVPPESAAMRKIRRTLQGKENFTGIQVESQRVEDFLSKTDGEKLVEPSGLDAEVVLTEAIAITAVSSTESAFSLIDIDIKTTSQVIIQQFTVDVEDGDDLVIMASAGVYAKGVAGGTRGDLLDRPTFTVYRGAVYLGGTRPLSVLRDMEMYASAAVWTIDTPPAGTHTIYFYSDLASVTDIQTLTADNRFLGCLRRRQDR